MRKVLLLTLGMFALGIDAYVVAGLLPEIGSAFKVSSGQTGLLVSVFTLCYALAAPIFATLLAGKSIRKILVVALIGFSTANGASALAPCFTWLLIARAVAGIGAGLYSPLCSAAGAALVSEEQRGQALGTILGGMSVGTVVGVPLGLMVASHLSWRGTFWLITALGLIAMVSIVISFPSFPASEPPSLRRRLAMMTNRHVAATVTVTFVTSVASLGLYTYVAVVLQYVTGIDVVAPYLWAWGAGGMAGSLLVGPLIDRMGRSGLLMAGILAILALSMFVIPTGLRIPIVAFIPFVLWGTMGWASQAPQQHVLLRLQPKHGAAAVALNSSANYLGSAVGSAVAGFVMLSGLPPSHLPIIAGCVVTVALLGQLTILSLTRRTTP